jgi:plasmid segregation protein ParM
VQNDKTEDERYFILSLFAIGKELADEAELMSKLTPNDHIKIELLIGLPLQHYEVYKDKFRRYFTDRKDIIHYELNGRKYSIRIADTHVFPQAYSAALTVCNKLADSRVVNIVDLGGFTVDCLQLNNFKPNMALCTSLYWGVNTLFQSINDQARAQGGNDISTSIIEGILEKDPDFLGRYSQKRIDIVTSAAISHVNRMLAEIAQKGFDLEEDTTVFMGGGSILLKDYFLKSGKVKKPVFIDDIHANAKGYMLAYDMQNGSAGSNGNTGNHGVAGKSSNAIKGSNANNHVDTSSSSNASGYGIANNRSNAGSHNNPDNCDGTNGHKHGA